MPYYVVNATVSYFGWVRVEADNEEAALEEARELHARDYEFDASAGQVEFNMTPIVEADEEA
jgi:hypothetical protein